jgi:two-component system sensor histidine kinase YesM
VDSDPRTELQPGSYLSLLRDLDRAAVQSGNELVLRIDVNPAVVLRHLTASELTGRIEVIDAHGTRVASTETPLGESEPFEFHHQFAGNGSLSGWAIRGTVAPAGSSPPWSHRWTLLLVVSGLSIAFSSLLVLLLSRSVTSRLGRLGRQMHRVASEDFSPIEATGRSNDEIAELIRDYNIMAQKIESLINDRYKAEIENHHLLLARQEAELDALQSQVNPHFLYNVLESVRMKAHIRGEVETADVVKKLSRSIRRLTSWHDDLIPLEEELQFVREYMDVQRYRFGERLCAAIVVESRALQTLIPKLSIQGLVENACVHGIESQPRGGTVRVTVAILADGGVRIVVEDDGVGCDTDELNRVASQHAPGLRHIGIANIAERLRLHYGCGASLVFSSPPDHGTHAEIRIAGIHETAEYRNDRR